MSYLSVRRVSKSFAGSPALSGANLDLAAGETHALMGENGAGKSTLIKILAGVLSPDALQLTVNGTPLPLASPGDAHAAGFRFIHQELNIVPQLSVAENISLGLPYPRRFGLAVDWPALRRRADRALARLGVTHIDPRRQAARLSTGDQMLMKIASALVAEDDDTDATHLYVLDEPTAALTGEESEKLFHVIAGLKAAGAAILYVSHRINEVMDICDRITVLRDGRNVFTAATATVTKQQVISAMTGRDVADAYPPRAAAAIGTDLVCQADQVASPAVSGLNFSLHAGEILGIAGLANAGQSDVLRLIMGLAPVTAGQLRVAGQPAPGTPSDAWSRGIAYVPRERRREGLMLRRSVRDNTVLPHLTRLARFAGAADRRAETAHATAAGHTVSLKSRSLAQPVYQLSGGNQQKVVFARTLMDAEAGAETPVLLLLDEPTRGVDIGAKFDIYSLIRRFSNHGCAVILTSSDLPEMLGMCDRLLIMRDRVQHEIVPTKLLTAADLLTRFYQPHVYRTSA